MGYNQVVLKALEAFFSSKRDVEKCGTLVLDEIKLREGVDFNKSTYKFDGFVEFENTGEKSKATLADHALVLMVHPFVHNWVQLIASSPLGGQLLGLCWPRLLWMSVLQLERHGATVLGVVSDGAGNNRSMWTHLGISGKLHHPVNKIPHPTLEDGRFLHFLCDVPHIIKCAGTNCINFQHYVHLYEAEKDSHIKIVPKFTSSHVKPSKLGKDECQTCDTGDRRLPVMLNETERNSIEKNTKLFASQLTTESLRVTLMSVLDIITLLLDKDVRYVLTAKLNQDPLERFFGVVRSFGGDEDHPTIVHFGQIFRLLSLYTPLKMATKGNCSGDADPVLVTMKESLSSKRLEVLHQKKEREDKLGQLMHSIVLEKLPEEDAKPHDYGRPTPHDAALYYLAGYVVKKAENFSSCGDCKATLLATNDVPSAAILTEMRSFVPGALQLPSKDLTSLLTDVESAITERTRDNVVFGDLLLVALSKI
ncbi:hypothetical protein HPB51_027173 [Rhipicephalus microplus]|uniref:Transposable element n=1 Tax=Rhipicephalus microplus TaxID=6941 RepID=A0A9J6D0U0_RHIMP|nr:hypothetical protein HPB51_027173 [Rhipicephalus microplus]